MEEAIGFGVASFFLIAILVTPFLLWYRYGFWRMFFMELTFFIGFFYKFTGYDTLSVHIYQTLALIGVVALIPERYVAMLYNRYTLLLSLGGWLVGSGKVKDFLNR